MMVLQGSLLQAIPERS